MSRLKALEDASVAKRVVPVDHCGFMTSQISLCVLRLATGRKAARPYTSVRAL